MPKSRAEFTAPEDPRFKETFFLVQATHFEKHQLWKEWHKSVDWQQEDAGYGQEIGTLADRPVVLSVFWVRINGRLVAFWELTSGVADYIMAENWFSQYCTPAKWDATRSAKCNASNFHLCIQAIEEENKTKPMRKRKKTKPVMTTA